MVDEGDFFELADTFAKNIVTGFGRIAGKTVGFVANQPMVLAGVLDSDASRKAARFVRFCDAFNISDRHLCGRAGLPAGHPRRNTVASSSTARSCCSPTASARLPLVTVITRKAYGGAFDVMASKEIGADMNYAMAERRRSR